jgi:histidinol-phosphatase
MTQQPPENDELKGRLDFALAASAEAAELIMKHYQSQDLQVESKGDASPVTIADRGAEELLRERIAERYPDDGVLGEEFDETPSQSGWRWILDPIDGTKSFIHGVPLFGTLVGLEKDDKCEVGVCRFPALNEVVYAASGGGAWWQIGSAKPQPARVSSVSSLGDACFCTTTVTGWDDVSAGDLFDRFSREAKLTRGWGDCYGHMLVATGRAEFMVDPKLNPWDAAALVPIVQEAGGHFVDWNGQPTIYSGNGLSVNANLRQNVLDRLHGN